MGIKLISTVLGLLVLAGWIWIQSTGHANGPMRTEQSSPPSATWTPGEDPFGGDMGLHVASQLYQRGDSSDELKQALAMAAALSAPPRAALAFLHEHPGPWSQHGLRALARRPGGIEVMRLDYGRLRREHPNDTEGIARLGLALKHHRVAATQAQNDPSPIACSPTALPLDSTRALRAPK